MRPGLALPDAGAADAPDARTAGAAGTDQTGDGGPGVETCAMQAFRATQLPVDLHLLLDTSDSMSRLAGTSSKWQRAVEALIAFVDDPSSAGLGVGITFFPQPTPTLAKSCEIAEYRTPAVEIAPLPLNSIPIRTVLTERRPGGSTPTRPAVEGTLAYLRKHAEANPNRRLVFLLATDGFPIGCGADNNIDGIAEILRAARVATPYITTYAIGVFGEQDRDRGDPAMHTLARAGGSGVPFVLSATDQLGQMLLDVLKRIRVANLGCQFAVPWNNQGIDFLKVGAVIRTSTGVEALDYVGSADRCDPIRGGFHYDIDPATSAAAPTRLITCPATCGKYQADPNAQVDLVFGCQTTTID